MCFSSTSFTSACTPTGHPPAKCVPCSTCFSERGGATLYHTCDLGSLSAVVHRGNCPSKPLGNFLKTGQLENQRRKTCLPRWFTRAPSRAVHSRGQWFAPALSGPELGSGANPAKAWRAVWEGPGRARKPPARLGSSRARAGCHRDAHWISRSPKKARHLVVEVSEASSRPWQAVLSQNAAFSNHLIR